MRALKIIAWFSLLMVAGCSSGTTQQPLAMTTASLPAATSAPATSASSQPAPSAAVAVKPKVDACALLTSKDVKSVQGEELQETKLAGHAAGGLIMSQCFFTLPTFSNSISLLVAEKGQGPEGQDPEEFWRDRFHEDDDRDKRDDKDHEPVGEATRKGEEEEEGAPRQKVSGVGREAYWVGNRVGGALYVLKGNAYLRISVGGPADQASKLKKSRRLAQKALARL